MKKPYVRSQKLARKRIVETYTTVAPTAGLNTRDPLGLMDERYAISMTNWIAAPEGLRLRKGYKKWVTGLPSLVSSMFVYNGVNAGTDKLFAASDGGIYDVTTPGAVGAASVSGLLSDDWHSTGFTGSAGNYLVVANGVDAVRHYNGTSWVTWTNVGVPATPGEISGIAPNLLTFPISHMRRLWFVQVNSTKAWYLPINSIGGAAVAFDFGPVFPRGGTLVALGSWSLDAGEGLSNMLVAVSSEGDVAVYRGTDPSSPTDWSIVATWALARPTMTACLLRYGGDLLYLCKDGLQPLSKYMQSTSTQPALTDAIQPTISEVSNTQAGMSGFALHAALSENLLLLNVPQIDPSANVQFVFNTITKGWSIFNGWPAQCWASYNGYHYFGDDAGNVCWAFTGFVDGADYDGTNGDVYSATAQTSFSYFENRAAQKRFTMSRLNLLTSSGTPNVLLAVNTDYDTTPPTSIGSAVPVYQSLWGLAVWDVDVWSSSFNNYNAWQSVLGLGYAGSMLVAVSSQGDTTWVTTDWVLETGGVI